MHWTLVLRQILLSIEDFVATVVFQIHININAVDLPQVDHEGVPGVMHHSTLHALMAVFILHVEV